LIQALGEDFPASTVRLHRAAGDTPADRGGGLRQLALVRAREANGRPNALREGQRITI
jgi:hypothetical protein